jgi:hypothetical protein
MINGQQTRTILTNLAPIAVRSPVRSYWTRLICLYRFSGLGLMELTYMKVGCVLSPAALGLVTLTAPSAETINSSLQIAINSLFPAPVAIFRHRSPGVILIGAAATA